MFAEGQEVGLLVLIRYRKSFSTEEFRLVGIVANQAGVTLHNAQLFERSRQLADTDRQLDVLNQAAFMQHAQRILSRARSANQSVALLYPDIDDFRMLNNTHGHPTGDRVLTGVADVMKEVVGEAGIVGRSGGEEFFILIPGTDEQHAMDTANEIRQKVQAQVFVSDDGREVKTTISTGVALFPRDAGDIASLVKQADRAAYLAKRMGKNRVCLYEDRKELIGSPTWGAKPSASDPEAEV
jgi:diguanylate cyclase (GGDEF)-like protein